MKHCIKNPLYPDFSVREFVEEEDYTLLFTDEELEAATKYLAAGGRIFSKDGARLMPPLGEYIEGHRELVPGPREGYAITLHCMALPPLPISEEESCCGFEVTLRYEKSENC